MALNRLSAIITDTTVITVVITIIVIMSIFLELFNVDFLLELIWKVPFFLNNKLVLY